MQHGVERLRKEAGRTHQGTSALSMGTVQSAFGYAIIVSHSVGSEPVRVGLQKSMLKCGISAGEDRMLLIGQEMAAWCGNRYPQQRHLHIHLILID